MAIKEEDLDWLCALRQRPSNTELITPRIRGRVASPSNLATNCALRAAAVGWNNRVERDGARVSYLLAQQTLLLSFKRSSFQSHLDSHLQTPPLLSINHPRLNGRFMQILILGTAPTFSRSPAPSLFLSPAFLRRSPFRQTLPPSRLLSPRPCYPYLSVTALPKFPVNLCLRA